MKKWPRNTEVFSFYRVLCSACTAVPQGFCFMSALRPFPTVTLLWKVKVKHCYRFCPHQHLFFFFSFFPPWIQYSIFAHLLLAGEGGDNAKKAQCCVWLLCLSGTDAATLVAQNQQLLCGDSAERQYTDTGRMKMKLRAACVGRRTHGVICDNWNSFTNF